MGNLTLGHPGAFVSVMACRTAVLMGIAFFLKSSVPHFALFAMTRAYTLHRPFEVIRDIFGARDKLCFVRIFPAVPDIYHRFDLIRVPCSRDELSVIEPSVTAQILTPIHQPRVVFIQRVKQHVRKGAISPMGFLYALAASA